MSSSPCALPPSGRSVFLGARGDEALARQTIMDGLRDKMGARGVRMDADRIRSNLDVFSADRRRHALAERPDGAVRRLARIDSLMFAGDDEFAVVGIVQIDIIFGEKPMT